MKKIADDTKELPARSDEMYFKQRLEIITRDSDSLKGRVDRLWPPEGQTTWGVPPGEPRFKAFAEKIAARRADLEKRVTQIRRETGMRPIVNNWKAVDREGWKKETAPLSYKEFISKPFTLNLEKTLEVFSKAQRIQQQVASSGLADEPELKSITGEAAQMQSEATDKLCRFASQILYAAEKGNFHDASGVKGHIDRLAKEVEQDAKGAPSGEPIVARAKKVLEMFDKQKKDEEGNRAATVAKLKQAADAAWPSMVKAMDNPPDFDPAACIEDAKAWKGRRVSIHNPQDVGGHYTTTGYDFVAEVNGIPVGCHMDPEIKTAAGTLDSQVHYNYLLGVTEMIAVVESTGQLERLYFAGGQLWKREHSPGPIVRVVAIKSGPFAAAVGQAPSFSQVAGMPLGAVGSGGSGTSRSSRVGFFGWMWRLVTVLICLVGSAAALVRAKFAPLATVPQVGQLQVRLGGNFDYVGLGCAAFGALWLLTGLIYRDLLPATALIAAGLYASQDFLRAKGWLKESQTAFMAPLGMPIGLAAAGLGFLHLLIGGWPLF